MAQEPADSAAFVAADSTLVVLVPATTDAAGALGAVRALRDKDVAAVYTTGDPAARRLARALSTTVGGSFVPYDRGGMPDEEFAAVLVRNALGANPRRAVVVVVEPGLVGPLFRGAAVAAGVDVGPTGAPGGRPDGVLVLTVAPDTPVLVRARY
jgi:hypothetical protein